MATDQELRILLRTQASTRGADETRAALRRVREEADRSRGGLASALGLGGDQGLLRAGAAFIGIGVGLNVAALAASRLHDALAGGVNAARDYNETVNKLDVVFDRSADALKRLGDTSATALGLSRNEALAAAGSFGNLFVSLGLTRDQAAKMSAQSVQLAADLASFHNIRPEDALAKLQSGLVGEIEPLRSVGVAINETQVQAKALALGLATSASTISEAAKVQARYALILEQTKTAQGDFARTSTGLANEQRILAARSADLAEAFGQTLLPVVQGVTEKLSEAAFSAGLLFKILNVTSARNKSFDEAIDQANKEIPALEGVLTASVAVERQQKVLARANEIYAASEADVTKKALGMAPAMRGSVAEFDALEHATIAASKAQDQLAHTNAVKAAEEGLAGRIVSLQRDQELAGRENLDLSIREAQARGELIPIQREMADVDARLFDLTDKRLALLREEAVVRAHIQANPANDALEDLQTQERRLRILATIKGPDRGQARRDLRTLIRSQAIPRAELGALDANAGVTAAERAQRDAALKEQAAILPTQRERAEIEQRLSVRQREVQEIGFLQAADKARSDEAIANIQKEVRAAMDAKQTLDDFLSGRSTFSTDRAAAFDLGAGPIKGPGFAKLQPPPVTVTATFNVTQQPGESSQDFGERILNDLAGTLAVAMTTAISQGTVRAGTPGGNR